MNQIMRRLRSPLLSVAVLVSFATVRLIAATSATESARVTTAFDADWRFLKADAPGAEKTGFDDSKWRKLDVPHDWSIEGPFAKTNKTGGAGAWAPSGVGWYRKHFTLPAEQKGKRVYVEFDGVMQNSEVWMNGVSLGKRPNGYVSFGYDLTSHVKFGEGATNILAVRADTSAQPASRWYSGAGIYRHVWLVVTEPVHLEPDASFVSTPVIKSNSATVHVETRVINDSSAPQNLTVMATVYGPPGSAPDGRYACAGESVPVSVAPGKSADVKFDVQIPWTPRLWSLERPDLHETGIRVRSGGKTLDDETVTFGVREFHFDATNGFSLNGKNFKL